ncbi:hypothetical protein BerOc1_01025 [Pseudodesulfovibrio hydrargyri]|uniref:Uncharacterized protein n=1 Tax=Pseudodesulfovibrio hydrargyri TaxID=2125990 RepID=A0A1J5NBJ8_9BACT|nr:hypothetical protein [Pseudodesulfovibrio hydrargyri]OIQ49105.1 hypothetical protein BerOc1_01025 [Pseudodesulfovibrio hydrargyri]
MQDKMHEPDETDTVSSGANDHAPETATGDGRTAVVTSENCACGDNLSSPGQGEDLNSGCSFVVTTFPEHISIFFGFRKAPYLFWLIVSVLLLIARILSMVLCDEENGRFAVNIVKSILPGVLAILIIHYSRQAKNVANAFCELFTHAHKERMIKDVNRRIRLVFNNRYMLITGAVLTVPFCLFLQSTQIYPTPTHNIIHKAGVRDRLSVNVGLTKYRTLPQDVVANAAVSEAENGKTGGQAILAKDPAIWGWVQLPLGKVIHLAAEFDAEKDKGEKWYKFLTDPPQETYAPHLPTPTHDEDLGLVVDENRRAEIDPEWDQYFGKKNKAYQPLTAKENTAAKKNRAQHLMLLGDFYFNTPVDDLWAYSQWTYQSVMLLLLFLGGAMIWCVGSIIVVTWNIGRCPPDEDVNPFSRMDLTFYPHPGESIGAAGDLLWQIAFITGSIYSLVMVCQFFAQPDTRSMILAGMFSPLVVILFIVPQYNLHKLMVDAKYRKISELDETLSKSLEAINPKSSPDDINRARNILLLQKIMSEANDWPCDLKSIAMVVSSVIIPVFMAIFTLYDHFK